MNDTVVIVTGAAALHPRALAAIPVGAIVLAADGGLDHARAAGLTPAGLIGDLDSVSPEGLEWAQAHCTIERHPSDKDLSDTELAVSFAAQMQPARLMLVGGVGDRLDHTLAAIGSLGSIRVTSIPLVELWWGDQYARVVHGPGRATLEVAAGTTISLLALHGRCTGVTVEGVKWPLTRAELEPIVGLGVGNVTIEPQVPISVSTGVLTVFVDVDGHSDSDAIDSAGDSDDNSPTPRHGAPAQEV